MGVSNIFFMRFSEDEMFPGLCKKAADTGLEPDKIK
ncbi:DUF6526 family protein [Paenibacillus mendelii]|uniref:DUF6526 family protein n=1 Tax=Paenibacillus mendelii TaxID=206163 RepID=A0ABV6JM33_9BACL|nr:DUF6526 family protein [Paenibacillus mendelii]MCQ6562251.1 DUF6526 family protein [Paenibacillus mendelii]